MRKVIGVGETVLDITFKNEQPISATPGGSVFNAMITLGRMGVPCEFISEVGRDRIGGQIKRFLEENNISSEFVSDYDGSKTPLALAYLDEELKPEYVFYKDYLKQRLDYLMPVIEKDDIVVIGSYFALNAKIHDRLTELLSEAKRKGAIIYYDVNFRGSHKEEVRFLMPNILDNFEYASIIKGSDEDFENIYGERDSVQTYKEHIEFYSKNFIYTKGKDGVTTYGKGFKKDYEANKIETVSTVGAGDNFNAGVIYGLIQSGVTSDDLKNEIKEETWDKIIRPAIDFSSHACTLLQNYVTPEFAEEYKKKNPLPSEEDKD